MKIWFTFPTLCGFCSRGVNSMTLWLNKPTYDLSPRGDDDPLFKDMPKGWRVYDPHYGDITSDVCHDVGRSRYLREERFNAMFLDVFNAVGFYLDGEKPEAPGCYDRWVNRPDCFSKETTDFLYEYDALPELWFRIAMHNGESQAAWAKWQQDLWADPDPLPF